MWYGDMEVFYKYAYVFCMKCLYTYHLKHSDVANHGGYVHAKRLLCVLHKSKIKNAILIAMCDYESRQFIPIIEKF